MQITDRLICPEILSLTGSDYLMIPLGTYPSTHGPESVVAKSRHSGTRVPTCSNRRVLESQPFKVLRILGDYFNLSVPQFPNL